MKLYLLILVVVLSFCSHLKHNSHSNAEFRQNTTAINRKHDSIKVDVYEDNELIVTYLYDGGLLREAITYNTQTKKQECRTAYHYKANGEYDRFEVIKGSDPICEDLREVGERWEGDYQLHLEFLKSKSINIPFADALSSEVSDLSKVLSVMDSYNDLRKEIEMNADQKVIRFSGLDKSIRFHPSRITGFIHDNTLIHDYELILKGGFPRKESYKTGVGELTREYVYDDEQRIVKVSYKFDGPEYKDTLEIRLDYHHLPPRSSHAPPNKSFERTRN